MKLLIDMNLSPRWINVLAEAGFEAVHWTSLGHITAPDSEIMAYAKAGGFVVLTHDLDFGTILAVTQGEKPSVVQIRSDDVTPAAIGAQVKTALTQMTAELEAGATEGCRLAGRSDSRLTPLPKEFASIEFVGKYASFCGPRIHDFCFAQPRAV